MKAKIHISENQTLWVSDIITGIVQSSKRAIAQRGKFTLVLSGGSTPSPVYAALGQLSEEMDWKNIYIFWGDERCVPPDHPDSNFNSANHTLLDHAAIPAENVFRMQGEVDPAKAANNYAQTIDSFFGTAAKSFDLILLGLGEDGHTASLFPNTTALKVTDELVVENQHPTSKIWRITLTYPALSTAREIFFLVKGKSKAEIIAEVLENTSTPPLLPAKKLLNMKDTIWYLDTEAAEHIKNNPNLEIITNDH